MRPQARSYVLRDRKARNTGTEERFVVGTDLSSDIAGDTELAVGVAAQVYTKIIDMVNHYFRTAEPSRHVITY